MNWRDAMRSDTPVQLAELGPLYEPDLFYRGRPVTVGTLVTPDARSPDLLRYEQIGAADNWRGRVVRAFFWLMRAWPVKPTRTHDADPHR